MTARRYTVAEPLAAFAGAREHGKSVAVASDGVFSIVWHPLQRRDDEDSAEVVTFEELPP